MQAKKWRKLMSNHKIVLKPILILPSPSTWKAKAMCHYEQTKINSKSRTWLYMCITWGRNNSRDLITIGISEHAVDSGNVAKNMTSLAGLSVWEPNGIVYCNFWTLSIGLKKKKIRRKSEF